MLPWEVHAKATYRHTRWADACRFARPNQSQTHSRDQRRDSWLVLGPRCRLSTNFHQQCPRCSYLQYIDRMREWAFSFGLCATYSMRRRFALFWNKFVLWKNVFHKYEMKLFWMKMDLFICSSYGTLRLWGTTKNRKVPALVVESVGIWAHPLFYKLVPKSYSHFLVAGTSLKSTYVSVTQDKFLGTGKIGQENKWPERHTKTSARFKKNVEFITGKRHGFYLNQFLYGFRSND